MHALNAVHPVTRCPRRKPSRARGSVQASGAGGAPASALPPWTPVCARARPCLAESAQSNHVTGCTWQRVTALTSTSPLPPPTALWLRP
eukprot:344408-Chlamydomonas_euryale.AAC.2